MKRLAILAAFVLVSQSCHRKEYALFNDPTTGPYLYQEKSQPIAIEETSTFAQVDTAETLTNERQLTIVSQPHSSLALSKIKKPQRVTAKKRQVEAKKLAKQNAKPMIQRKAGEPKNLPSRNLGIASLVLGAIGLLLLIPSLITLELVGLAFSGLLLGITGLVLGIVSLVRVKNSSDKPTGRNAAGIGVALSSITVIGGSSLLMTILIVSIFSAFLSCS